MNNELYFEENRYNSLVGAINRLEAHPETGKLDPCEIKTALGEFGDIWPESIREDSEKYNH